MIHRETNSNVGVLALLCAMLFYVHQKNYDSPTPLSRLDLLHALHSGRTFAIDGYPSTPDRAEWLGNSFSDKAPGTACLAYPLFNAAALGCSLFGADVESRGGWLFTSWIVCAGSLALITALGGTATYRWLDGFTVERWSYITALGVFLGAAPLPYSTMLFSHGLVAGLLAIALWAVEKQNQMPRLVAFALTRTKEDLGAANVRSIGATTNIRQWLANRRWDMLAGHTCGWALASEYSSGLVVVGVFLWMVSFGWRRAIPFCLAAIPPLLLIPAYSYACFGNPFILPYSLQASFPAMQEGLYAIKWPDAQTAFNLLFSPTRGLFFWSPFLLMAFIGYPRLYRESPKLFWLTYAVPVLHIVVISGRVWDWQAGPTLGPRLLAPILPLLALPCAYGVQQFPKLGIALAAYSIGITTLATLTDACPAGSIYNPLLELHIPLFLKGEFSPNLGMVLGLPPYASVALYYAILIGGIAWLWRRLPNEENMEPVK